MSGAEAGDSTELIQDVQGRAGRLRLNRPKALHALSYHMIQTMSAALSSWREDDAVRAVIVDHAQGRGFCAGGDIRQLISSDTAFRQRFFLDEYHLNHLLFTYAKPIIAFMDGITMGGGAGISLPARYRVATEHTRFAMPEAGIGLFPDIGGSWYLSRLPGQVGRYLGLIGARLDGAECLALGVATHYLPAASLDRAKALIANDAEHIDDILAQLSVTPPSAGIIEKLPLIDRLFAADTLEDIGSALRAEGSDWSNEVLAALASKCPVSCKVTLRQLAEGAKCQDFAEIMRMEYRIVNRMLARHDFTEGVRAAIIDKDNQPRWDPATPQEVDASLIDAIFAPLPATQEWNPL